MVLKTNPYIGVKADANNPFSTGISSIVNVGFNPAFNYTPTSADILSDWYGSGGGGGGGVNVASAWDWGLDALNALGSLSKPVTQQLANWTDGKRTWGDNPFVTLGREIGRGAKGQWNAWNDGQISFKDIPVLGGLSEIGENGTGFNQTLTNLGNKYDMGFLNSKAAQIGGGIAGDILFDPLTWLTFGAGGAAKATLSAGRGAAKELAADVGMNVGKQAEKSIDAILKTTRDQAFKSARSAGDNIYDAFNKAKTAQNSAQDLYNNAINSAAGRAKNALVNIDVPFTNWTKQFGTKPQWAMKQSPKVGTLGANRVTQMLDDINLSASERSKLLKDSYGVDDVASLTLQQYKHLQTNVNRFVKSNNFNSKYNNFGDITKLTSAINKIDPNMADSLQEILQTGMQSLDNLTMTPAMVREFGEQQVKALGLGADTAKVFTDMYDQAANAVQDMLPKLKMSKFVEGAGGRSKLTDFVARKTGLDKMLNARSFGAVGEGVLNQGASKIADAQNKVFSRTMIAEQELSKVQKLAKVLTEDEQNAIIYKLEGEAPYGYDPTKVTVDSAKVDKVAQALQTIFSKVAKAETGAGALDDVRADYFTHEYVNPAELAAKYPDDKYLGKIMGSAGNKYNRKRKSFDTIAALDNYASGLMNTDPQKAADIRGLINRDVIEVSANRYLKSARTVVMKELFKELEADGLILRSAPTSGLSKFKRITDSLDSDMYDIPKGSYVAKDVYDALKDVDRLFTSDGFETFFRGVMDVQNIWKALVTVVRPVHHFNNIIGNLLNNALAGIGFTSYKNAGKFMLHFKRGKLNDNEAKLLYELMDKGVLHGGISSDFKRAVNTEKAGTLTERINKVLRSKNGLTFIQRTIGDTSDQFTRVAHYLEKRYLGADEAAASVRKYLFNYNELTKSDKLIRSAVPFWNWMKNNIPLQLEKALQQPRFYSIAQQLQESSFEANDIDFSEQADFIQQGYFVTPWGSLRSARAPMEDIYKLSDPLGMLTSSVSPLIKMPFEVSANHNLFKNAPIDYSLKYQGERDPQAWREYFIGQTGLGNDMYKLFNSDENNHTGVLDILFGKELEVR